MLLRPARFLAIFALLFVAGGLTAQEASAPLFQDESPLLLRIESDFKSILDDREEESTEYPGQVVVIGEDGSESPFPAQVRTRGRFRLLSNTCDFPPIRVNFPKGEVEGSIFDGQDKIKVVTHCRDRYEGNLVREYLVYRLYNLLTPSSFRVRMARITWVDTSGEEEPIERFAFFIEMEEAMAERLGGEVIPEEELTNGLHPARIQTSEASRVSLFEYMVGNTDFSMYGSPGVGPHNVVPVQLENGRVIPVPYDFDWTGMVDASYARPDPSLGIRRVTQRVYRGLCRGDLDYAALYQSFLAKRADITALIQAEDLLPDDDREDVLDYLDEFWETLESDRNSERRIERACRQV